MGLAVIAELPPDCGAILRLVHGQRLPLKEAAQLIGRSEAATRKLYGRALRAFTERARP